MGFLINPVAGMGGAVGLKGTDNLVAEAMNRGARPVSPDRAKAALEALRGLGPDVLFFTASGEMGERVLQKSGFEYQIVYQAPEDTGAEDSRTACRAFLDRKVDLVVFCGGDGKIGRASCRERV